MSENSTRASLPWTGKSAVSYSKCREPGSTILTWTIHEPAGRITVTPEHPATILLRREQGFMHQGFMQPMYFYVPKGTRKIEYFWSGGPHQILGPDKKLVKKVTISDDFVQVSVPKGMDGKTWSFTELVLGHLWFLNVPNLLAASPDIASRSAGGCKDGWIATEYEITVE